jgi:hypothetical protein
MDDAVVATTIAAAATVALLRQAEGVIGEGLQGDPVCGPGGWHL